MAKEYVLHIGPPKTGTTSLQVAFRNNREALRQRGILYPEYFWEKPIERAHHKLARVLNGEDSELFGLPENWRESFLDQTSDADICVLSSEFFSNIQKPEAVASLFPPSRTKIVIYVREPVSHVVSRYQNKVKKHNLFMSFQEFSVFYRVPYLDLADRWSGAFGREKVLLRLYDREVMLGGDIVADFANLVRPGLEMVFSGQEHARNRSVAGNLLFVKRVLNRFISLEESLSVRHEVGKLSSLDKFFTGSIPIDQKTEERIRKGSDRDFDMLKERFGFQIEPRQKPITGPLFPDYEKLAQDYRRIRNEAKNRGRNLATLLGRMENIFT